MTKNPRKETEWIGKDEVCRMTGAAYLTIQRHMKAGTFPQARYHFAKLRWKRHEVEDWLDSQPTPGHPDAPKFNTDKAVEGRKKAAEELAVA